MGCRDASGGGQEDWPDLCSAIRGTQVQCCVPKISAMRCTKLKYSEVQWSTVQCSGMESSGVQCIAVHCSALQCSAEQSSAVQCSAVQQGSSVYRSAETWLMAAKLARGDFFAVSCQ